ncbi:MAG: S41 family peptidase [Anaerolineales bacterium]
MKSNRPLLITLIVLIASAICLCTVSAASLSYYFFQDEITRIFRDPSIIFNPQPGSSEAPVETPIPIGQETDLASLFAPMWESRQFLQQDFVEQPVSDQVLGQGAFDGLNAFLETFGVDLDDIQVTQEAPSAGELSQQADTPQEAADDFLAFWEAWRKVQYGSTTILTSQQELMRISLSGMVDALDDDHTGYLDPFELQQSDLSLQGEYEGIGAWVDTTTDYVTIIAPMEGSPAEAAGLQPGDVVLAVDGRDMTGVDGDVVISYILGPRGSTVVLTIQREGEPEPFEVSIVRDRIFVPSVESEVLDSNIAYVQLFAFGTDSASELHAALEEVMAQNPRGLILDLRNNGGGFLDTAVSTTSEFIEDGVVLYEEYGDGSREAYETLGNGLATEIPLIVLVNQGTASASEILAGAIQDYERGILLGETTFGKGSVQISRLLSNNQGALRITVAHWLTPDERQIHGLGLEPDVFVELTEEDAAAERDPQLDEAIRLLTSRSSLFN